MAFKELMCWMLVLHASLSLQQTIPLGVGFGAPTIGCLGQTASLSIPLPVPLPRGVLTIFGPNNLGLIVQSVHGYPFDSFSSNRVVRNIEGVAQGWMNFTLSMVRPQDSGLFTCYFRVSGSLELIRDCGQNLVVVNCGNFTV